MTALSKDVFQPRDGAALDLRSLMALGRADGDVLAAWLSARMPGASGVVLEGLDLSGDVAPGGPPGTVRPDGLVGGAVVSPGRALVTGRDGRLHVLTVSESLHVPWPDQTGPRARGTLVLFSEAHAAQTEGGLAVARERLEIKAGFVRPDAETSPHIVPIARAVGNGQDWATDLSRILQPEHPSVRFLLKRMERIEVAVWQAEPEGSVWDRQVLGRSWVRYQTVAAAAVQAAVFQLETLPMSTTERVRLLRTLRERLERSVERAAIELQQIIGSPDGAGPYLDALGLER